MRTICRHFLVLAGAAASASAVAKLAAAQTPALWFRMENLLAPGDWGLKPTAPGPKLWKLPTRDSAARA